MSTVDPITDHLAILRQTIDHLLTRQRELVDLLDECREFIDNYADVSDGDDGQPVANTALSLVGQIDRVVGRSALIEALGAIERAHGTYSNGNYAGCHCDACKQARAVLAKAEGR